MSPQMPWLQNSAPTIYSVSINELQEKFILFWLCRWFKQVHCLMGGLGSLAVDCTRLRGYTSEQGPGGLANPRQPSQGKARKKKKECVLCEIYGLQKITAPASVFCYWRHVKAMATKGKFNSLVSKANHCRNPKEVWDTSDMNNIISWLRRRCHGDQHLTDTSVHPELWPWACVRTEKFKFERELYSTQITGAKRIPNISGLPMNP